MIPQAIGTFKARCSSVAYLQHGNLAKSASHSGTGSHATKDVSFLYFHTSISQAIEDHSVRPWSCAIRLGLGTPVFNFLQEAL